jgi:hypothetical protein
VTEKPSRELLASLAADRELVLSDAELEAAREMHVRFRAELERLRKVPLAYLAPYVEPATAIAWIERGGRSA